MKTLIRLLAPLGLTLTVAACTTDATDRGGEGERGRGVAGKADHLEGSCAPLADAADFCGTQSPDGCWCDPKCAEYGDCCGDAPNLCEVDECIPGTDKGCGDDQFCMPGVCLAFCLPDDPGCCAPATCQDTGGGDGGVDCSPQDAKGTGLCELFFGVRWDGSGCEPLGGCDCVGDDCDELHPTTEICEAAHTGCAAVSCEEMGGECMSDPGDPGFPALCETLGHKTLDGECEAFNQACCLVLEPPPPATCEGNCGGAALDKACYCDDACTEYGDCCDDYKDFCGDEPPPPPPGGEACGPNTCAEGMVCCNSSCGICTLPGEFCIQIACGPV